jgi:hypothetical protein
MFNQNMRINFLAILLAQFVMIKNLCFFPGIVSFGEACGIYLILHKHKRGCISLEGAAIEFP